MRIVIYHVIDNGLENFKLNVSFRQTYDKKDIYREPGRWIKPGQVIRIGSKSTDRGFIYFGSELKSLDKYFIESSLINPDLKINFNTPDKSGALMGYWPNYSTILPESRAAYINWLTSDRDDLDINIGYIFLYFYGLERRLIVDSKKSLLDSDELDSIIKELYRLKSLYGKNRSFNQHVINLLSFCVTIFPTYFSNKIDRELFIGHKKFTHALKFTLGSDINNGKPLDENLAFLWLLGHPDYLLKTPAKRCSREFEILFKIKFLILYSDGIKINPNKKRLVLLYTPSSASLKKFPETNFQLPDICRLKAPFKKILDIADDVTSELEGYSRFIGRGGNIESLEALTYLPIELKNNIYNPKFIIFKESLEKRKVNDHIIMDIPTLYSIIGDTKESTVSKKEFSVLEKLIRLAGYSVAPNYTHHNEKTNYKDLLVLYPDSNLDNFIPSKEFLELLKYLKLSIGFLNDKLTLEHKDFLRNVIKSHKSLTSRDAKSLNAYLMWRYKTLNHFKGIKNIIESLTLEERIKCGKIIVDLKSISGKLESDDKIEIENFYKKLGLSSSDALMEINSRNLFSLDSNLLKKHEKDTKEVQSILETIFIDDIVEADFVSTDLGGLNDVHKALYTYLIEKEEWTYSEIETRCNDLGLLTNGAIEVINDWAFDMVDAPLIEDGETIFIDFEILDEIKQTIKQEKQ